MPTAVANVFDGIRADYGVAMEESGQAYPALQATTYEPRSLSEKVGLCLSEKSFDMLDSESDMGSLCKPETCIYDGNEETMWVLPEESRWAVLGIPRTFILDKKTGEISYPQKGERLAGTSKVTATRLLLAMVKPDGELLMGADGFPQLFTLKLTSNKTCLVNGNKRDPDFKSLAGLNDALQAHFKKRGVSLTHLVSLALQATPKKFSSTVSDESKTGIMFTLQGGAKPLSEAQQLMMFELLKDSEVMAMIQDPFRLKNREDAVEQPMTINPDDIAF